MYSKSVMPLYISTGNKYMQTLLFPLAQRVILHLVICFIMLTILVGM